jgi:hypothetical protein
VEDEKVSWKDKCAGRGGWQAGKSRRARRAGDGRCARLTCGVDGDGQGPHESLQLHPGTRELRFEIERRASTVSRQQVPVRGFNHVIFNVASLDSNLRWVVDPWFDRALASCDGF